ncbi:centromere protein C isoform X2 [Humulus lupulus]|uniref:centromere protein C isoform X2 n=1 Tax=Humulus lupulus TaxID=3486 RepID=UPI002B4124AA|nr:centromere protein C isoform X2 [Humulus lupulus]
MVTGHRASDLVDPLQEYSGLALFPHTFEVLPEASYPYDFDRELQAIHNHLNSAALRSPLKLRDQAKVIVDGNSKTMNSKVTVDSTVTVPGIAEGNPRERRPALGRKRARFSLKPNSSQPAKSFEQPKLDLKNLKDPNEFFMAYERHENAIKEIRKQMGGTQSESDEENPSKIGRSRRPGMLKRSVKYKHLYSSEISETNKNVLSSQETVDSSNCSPDHHISQPESDHDFMSQETELTGSIQNEEGNADEILDQLLSCNAEELDGNRALNLLQEHLQIKPIELEKLRLPDFQDIPKVGLKSSRGGKLPKRSHVLSNIDNMLKGLSSKTPMQHKQGAEPESPLHHVASPTPSKSPLASLSALKQRLSRSNSFNDLFSPHDIDNSPAPNPPTIECNDNTILFDVVTQSVMKSPLFEKDENVEDSITGSPEAAISDLTNTHKKSVYDDRSKLDGVIDVGSSASQVTMNDNMTDSYMDNSAMIENLGGLDADRDAQARGAKVDDKVEDIQQETVVSTDSGLHLEELTLDNSNAIQSHLDEPRPASVEGRSTDMHSRIPDDGSEQHTEMIEENSRIPLVKKRKEKSDSQKVKKRREISGSGRKSLAGAGTNWESGVRRSTRIRCRPLEFWKGEKLLYGRVHKSLPTVIGLKYASPDKGNGKLALKVRSYVSDEHKELLELAALH